MKKIILLLLLLLFSSSIVYSYPFCFKNSICIKEYKKGLYIIKVNTKKHKISTFIINNGFDTTENVYKNNDFLGVLNGGFFDFKSKKTVSFVTKNKEIVLDPLENENLTKSLYFKNHLDLIINRSEFRKLLCEGEIKYDITYHYDTVPKGCFITDALQAGPMLYPEDQSEKEFFTKKDNNGKLIRNAIQVDAKRPRTAIALKNNNIYFIIATKNYPLKLDEIIELSKKKKFEKVLNLDGGGSTSFTNDKINVKCDKNNTQRKVKSFLIIEKKI